MEEDPDHRGDNEHANNRRSGDTFPDSGEWKAMLETWKTLSVVYWRPLYVYYNEIFPPHSAIVSGIILLNNGNLHLEKQKQTSEVAETLLTRAVGLHSLSWKATRLFKDEIVLISTQLLCRPLCDPEKLVVP